MKMSHLIPVPEHELRQLVIAAEGVTNLYGTSERPYLVQRLQNAADSVSKRLPAKTNPIHVIESMIEDMVYTPQRFSVNDMTEALKEGVAALKRQGEDPPRSKGALLCELICELTDELDLKIKDFDHMQGETQEVATLKTTIRFLNSRYGDLSR